jgi:hypothetical protein
MTGAFGRRFRFRVASLFVAATMVKRRRFDLA